MEKILQQGAEAILIHKDNQIIKRRIKKSYRITILDEKLRKLRTRNEGKIIEKLSNIINVPKIIKVDEKAKEITMEFLEGKKLSDNLDNFELKEQEKICKEIGKEVGKMHDKNINHGDLTTSNMILKDNKVYLIDFGLSFHSLRVEDNAVDLHLFKQALESKHFQHWEKLFEAFLQGYNPNKKDKIIQQLVKVEGRGRYKH